MNFKKLTKEKRNNLILVVMLTLGIVGGLGFGLIRRQYDYVNQLGANHLKAQAKLQKMREAVNHADRIETELTEAKGKLAGLEEDIASGDLYASVIGTLRRFKLGYKVEMPQFSPIGPVSEMNLMPGFPYKQAGLTVAGTAHFHDFGHFLADFENEFPHMRVQNLRLDSVPGANAEDPEKLTFNMEIVTLVK